MLKKFLQTSALTLGSAFICFGILVGSGEPCRAAQISMNAEAVQFFKQLKVFNVSGYFSIKVFGPNGAVWLSWKERLHTLTDETYSLPDPKYRGGSPLTADTIITPPGPGNLYPVLFEIFNSTGYFYFYQSEKGGLASAPANLTVAELLQHLTISVQCPQIDTSQLKDCTTTPKQQCAITTALKKCTFSAQYTMTR